MTRSKASVQASERAHDLVEEEDPRHLGGGRGGERRRQILGQGLTQRQAGQQQRRDAGKARKLLQHLDQGDLARLAIEAARQQIVIGRRSEVGAVNHPAGSGKIEHPDIRGGDRDRSRHGRRLAQHRQARAQQQQQRRQGGHVFDQALGHQPFADRLGARLEHRHAEKKQADPEQDVGPLPRAVATADSEIDGKAGDRDQVTRRNAQIDSDEDDEDRGADMRPGRDQDRLSLADDAPAHQPDHDIGHRVGALRHHARRNPGQGGLPARAGKPRQDPAELPAGERGQIRCDEMNPAEEEAEPSQERRDDDDHVDAEPGTRAAGPCLTSAGSCLRVEPSVGWRGFAVRVERGLGRAAPRSENRSMPQHAVARSLGRTGAKLLRPHERPSDFRP
jgi:hypothetical protein